MYELRRNTNRVSLAHIHAKQSVRSDLSAAERTLLWRRGSARKPAIVTIVFCCFLAAIFLHDLICDSMLPVPCPGTYFTIEEQSMHFTKSTPSSSTSTLTKHFHASLLSLCILNASRSLFFAISFSISLFSIL